IIDVELLEKLLSQGCIKDHGEPGSSAAPSRIFRNNFSLPARVGQVVNGAKLFALDNSLIDHKERSHPLGQPETILGFWIGEAYFSTLPMAPIENLIEKERAQRIEHFFRIDAYESGRSHKHHIDGVKAGLAFLTQPSDGVIARSTDVLDND